MVMNRKKDRNIVVELMRTDLRSFRQHITDVFQSRGYEKSKELIQRIKSNNILASKFLKSFQCMKLSELGENQLYYNQYIDENEMLDLTTIILGICSDPINQFVCLRDEYEKYLTKNEIEKAEEVLSAIEKNIGYSVWGLGQKLLLAGMKGDEAKDTLWREYLISLAGHNTVIFLLDHQKRLSDLDISYAKYIIELEKHLGVAATDGKRYVESKLRIDRFVDASDVSLVLQIDLQISIIDYYLSYEDYLLSKSEFIFHTKEYSKISSFLPKGPINSSIINNIKICIGEEGIVLRDTNKNVFQIIDLYSKGEYEEAIITCLNYLEYVPNDFQIACILCKSYIYLGRDISKETVPTYIKCLYSIYSIDDNLEKSATELQREIRKYYGIGLGIKIRSFLCRKNIIDAADQFCLASFILDEILSPNCLRQIESDRIETIVVFFKKYYNESVDSVYGIIKGRPELSSVSSDPIRNTIARIQCFCYTLRLEDAKQGLLILSEFVRNRNSYFYERYLQLTLLYDKMGGYYQDAVRLLVDIFFADKKIYDRILSKSLFVLEYRSKDEKIIKDINHMILTHLMYPTDASKKIIVYNNLLDSNCIDSVEKCILLCDSEESDKWKFFLKHICTIDLLRMDDRLYMSNKKPEQVRVSILKQLHEKYQDESCYQEIFEIEKLESIQDKIETIKNGRINVDTDKIFDLNKEEWRETFQQFLSVRHHKEDTYYIDYLSQDRVIQFSMLEKQNGRLVYRSIPHQEQLHQIMADLVSSISNELLYNPQFGLETYLSARIRHGYCKGQLISFLQNLDLIAIYDKNTDSYNISKYWREKCGTHLYDFEEIKSLIVGFTIKIDQKIKEILSSWLRIRIINSGTGLFNYESLFSDDVINTYLSIMEAHADFSRLYREIVDTFWKLTNDNLLCVRKRIDTELRDYYIASIDSAIEEIPKEFRRSDSRREAFRELNNRFLKAKAELTLILQQFKEAFVHSNKGYQDFTLEELGECTQRTVRQLYNAEQIQWHITADRDSNISGLFFLPFVDILCILADNAIKHSGIQDKKNLHLTINMSIVNRDQINPEAIKGRKEFDKVDKYISIAVTNNVNRNIDIDTVEEKLKRVFMRIGIDNEAKKDIQREGGTGLVKLTNIIEFQINWLYFIEHITSRHEVTIHCIIGADQIIKGAQL